MHQKRTSRKYQNINSGFHTKAWLEDSTFSCLDVYILQSFYNECLLLIHTENFFLFY